LFVGAAAAMTMDRDSPGRGGRASIGPGRAPRRAIPTASAGRNALRQRGCRAGTGGCGLFEKASKRGLPFSSDHLKQRQARKWRSL